MTERAEPSTLLEARARIRALESLINSPEILDFIKGVQLEAAHQVERWGPDHDARKTPFDWFWTLGYLSQKAADAAARGDLDKARHHTISSAALLANWHRHLMNAASGRRKVPEDPLISAEAAALAAVVRV